MNHSTTGLPVQHQLPEFTETHVHRVGDAIQSSHRLSSPSPLTPNPSQYQSLFQWVNSSHEVAKVLEFSFSIIPSKEIPGLISFRIDWLDLLAVQGTLKSLLQHHSSKASILRHSAFFTVQLSLPYMTTGKAITLTRRTFVNKVMSLLFNMLSRLVITFLPGSKRNPRLIPKPDSLKPDSISEILSEASYCLGPLPKSLSIPGLPWMPHWAKVETPKNSVFQAAGRPHQEVMKQHSGAQPAFDCSWDRTERRAPLPAHGGGGR